MYRLDIDQHSNLLPQGIFLYTGISPGYRPTFQPPTSRPGIPTYRPGTPASTYGPPTTRPGTFRPGPGPTSRPSVPTGPPSPGYGEVNTIILPHKTFIIKWDTYINEN